MIRAFVAAYVAAGVVMISLDAVWLTATNRILYQPALHDLLAGSFRPGPAVAFYAIYLVGVVVLAIMPTLESGGWRRAALSGGVLGVVAYGTYDLTNQATLVTWSTSLTVIDMTWGAILTAACAAAGQLAGRANTAPAPAAQ